MLAKGSRHITGQLGYSGSCKLQKIVTIQTWKLNTLLHAIDDCNMCYEIKNHYQICINCLRRQCRGKIQTARAYVGIGHHFGEQ